MKKFLVALSLLLCPFSIRAALTDPQVIQEKTYVVHYATTVAALGTQYFDLISLSTTPTLFPHTAMIPQDTGEIDINYINISVDKAAASTETVKLGVITAINTSTTSITYFFNNPSQLNVSNTNVLSGSNFSPAFYRTKVKPSTPNVGATPYILSNDNDNNSTVINSSTTYLSSPLGVSVTPGLGDIIMKVINGSAIINVVVDVWYHAER